MKIRTVPNGLTQGLRGTERERVDLWWRELHPQEQMQVAALWDSRHDDTSLVAEGAGDQTKWHELPIQLKGRLVDEETRLEDRMLKQQLFDYIVNHEEVTFFLKERTYHICRAHHAARAVIKNGFLPASFQCPLGHGPSCPMQILLAAAGGKSVEIHPRVEFETVP